MTNLQAAWIFPIVLVLSAPVIFLVLTACMFVRAIFIETQSARRRRLDRLTNEEIGGGTDPPPPCNPAARAALDGGMSAKLINSRTSII